MSLINKIYKVYSKMLIMLGKYRYMYSIISLICIERMNVLSEKNY